MDPEYYIQELIEKKTFSELSEAEKAIVLLHITPLQYQQRREMLLFAVNTMASEKQHIAEHSDLKKNIKSLMHKNKKQLTITAVVTYKVPVYAPAIALLLILILGIAYNKPVVTSNKVTAKNIVYLTDTVYLEKKVPVEKIKYVTSGNKKMNTVIADEILMEKNDTLLSISNFEFAKQQVQDYSNAIGSSTADHQELNKFPVTAN